MMRAECLVRTTIADHPWPAVINESPENGKKEFSCPHCAYTTLYRHRYKEHLGTHYSDNDSLQDNNSDYQDDDETPSKRKSKSFKCKQCNYVTNTKLDFWEHSKGHIKAEKLLTCPKCPFVTEYKHHLEYHLRNHFGSKPFKCTKCSYSCVNKSMLNSHLKSHSNVYQYRCSDCAYATKYCHSLKLHLRKYEHKPAMVLNADGTPNPLPIIDIYGTRRGPKQKAAKTDHDPDDKSIFLDIRVPSADKNVPNLPGGVVVPNAPQVSPQSPSSIYSFNNNDIKEDTQNGTSPKFYYCTICEFHTIAPEILRQHMFLHAAETNLVHIFKTNNNVQDSTAMKDYIQNVFNQVDQAPFVDTRSNSPLSLISPKLNSPEDPKQQTASPLDLSKQDNCESENDTSQESKQIEQTNRKNDSENNNLKNSSSTKHRRKGKAYKLERITDRFESSPEEFYSTTNDDSFKIKLPKKSPIEKEVDLSPRVSPKPREHDDLTERLESPKRFKPDPDDKQLKTPQEPHQVENGKELHCCGYCDIAFKDIIMYTMHMGYHGYQDPFTCNMCGHITPDKVSFFLHIARSSHS